MFLLAPEDSPEEERALMNGMILGAVIVVLIIVGVIALVA